MEPGLSPRCEVGGRKRRVADGAQSGRQKAKAQAILFSDGGGSWPPATPACKGKCPPAHPGLYRVMGNRHLISTVVQFEVPLARLLGENS